MNVNRSHLITAVATTVDYRSYQFWLYVNGIHQEVLIRHNSTAKKKEATLQNQPVNNNKITQNETWSGCISDAHLHGEYGAAANKYKE